MSPNMQFLKVMLLDDWLITVYHKFHVIGYIYKKILGLLVAIYYNSGVADVGWSYGNSKEPPSF